MLWGFYPLSLYEGPPLITWRLGMSLVLFEEEHARQGNATTTV